MTEAEAEVPPGRDDQSSSEVLRRKYLDYCSSQVADILLLLSPDELYALAQQDAAGDPASGELTFTEMVRLATEHVSRKLALPPFEVWVEDYLAHPDRYERYLMGLWQSDEDPDQDG